MPKRGGKKNRNNIINKKKKKNPVLERKTSDVQPESDAVETIADHPDPDTVVREKDALRERDSDVGEGKTIFIRNLSYNTEEEDVAELMSGFGDLDYCVICRDKDTGQSRGSAFVKFRTAASAEAAVAADKSDLVVDGRSLNIDFALERTQVQKVTAEKGQKERDKRNLFLQHEGWIRAGTAAADGVSTTDLQKRASLAEKKKTLLKLLTNFVSKTRLCIHNLPPDMENKELKALFQEAAGSGARITECRVMRNRLANGKFTGSKGFGFVQFVEHQHALLALRKLNNNPAVFSNAKRPIVEFSIENMYALKKLQRRAEKASQQANASETEDQTDGVKQIAKKIGVTPRSVQRKIKLNNKKKQGNKKKSKKR